MRSLKLSGVNALEDRGVYRLTVFVSRASRIKVGRLGTFQFPRGYYLYTGRALKGLRGRLERHLGKRRNLRWHIDYLLEAGRVRQVEVAACGTPRDECRFNSRGVAVTGGTVFALGFGSSDCRCPSHLIYTGKRPEVGRPTA